MPGLIPGRDIPDERYLRSASIPVLRRTLLTFFPDKFEENKKFSSVQPLTVNISRYIAEKLAKHGDKGEMYSPDMRRYLSEVSERFGIKKKSGERQIRVRTGFGRHGRVSFVNEARLPEAENMSPVRLKRLMRHKFLFSGSRVEQYSPDPFAYILNPRRD
jgi:hypothetical protein